MGRAASSDADRPRAAARIRVARVGRERHRSPEVLSPGCRRCFGLRIMGLALRRLPVQFQVLTCLPSNGILGTKVFSQPWKASIFPRLAEWFNASDYESDEEQSSAGSNPAPSAKPLRKRGGLIGSGVYFSHLYARNRQVASTPQSRHMGASATSSGKCERPQQMQRRQPTPRTSLDGSELESNTETRRRRPVSRRVRSASWLSGLIEFAESLGAPPLGPLGPLGEHLKHRATRHRPKSRKNS